MPRTALLGRGRLAAEIGALVLGDAGRLVTLTGAGGCGKTSLALRVASDLRGSFPDGVVWAELAPLAEAALVPGAVAAAAGVAEVPGPPSAAALAAAWRDRGPLVVLDNCEHLVEAVAYLADLLLSACPSVRILATSREPLLIAGERQVRVPPLAAPDPDRLPAPEELARYPAVRLFAERARAVEPAFRLTPGNVAAVARICAHLDGLPLAIELAAARARALSVAQIEARLDDRFRVLVGGSRTAPTRQQTLRATLDWSFALLDDEERALFRRLAVFAGSWDLEAVEAVGGGGEIAAGDVLGLLSRLAEKSLVVAEERDGAVRYHLLETVRQYAREVLEASGEGEAVRRAHAAQFLAVAERASARLDRNEQVAAVAAFEREHDNLRAALSWLTDRGEVEAGLRLGEAVARFWGLRGYFDEGRDRLARLLAIPSAPTPARAATLLAAGHLAWAQGDYRAQQRLYEESLAVSRELDGAEGIARALSELATLAFQQGRYAEARRLLEEGLERARAAGQHAQVALHLMRLAAVARDQGAFAEAHRFYDESLALRRALGDLSGVAHVLSNMGWLALYEGDYAAARGLQEESLAIRRELGDRREVAVSLTALARVDAAVGDAAAAGARYREGLLLHREVRNQWGIALTLEGLAELAAEREPERSLRLAGAASTLRVAIGRPLPPVEQPAFERWRAKAHTILGEQAASDAWAAGQAAELDRAIAETQDSAEGNREDSRSAGILGCRENARTAAGSLTRRERDVVKLIAAGTSSDREIAGALSIAESTAGLHVQHILAKLGFHSRWQIVAWARNLDLDAPSAR